MSKLILPLIMILGLTTSASQGTNFSEIQKQASEHLVKSKTVAGYLKSVKGKIKNADYQFLSEKVRGLSDTKISWSSGERNTLTIDKQVTYVGSIKNNIDNTGLTWEVNGRQIEFAKNSSAESLWPLLMGALPKDFSQNLIFDLFLPRAEANPFFALAAGATLAAFAVDFVMRAEVKTCETYDSFAGICDFNLKACSGVGGCGKNLNHDISAFADFDMPQLEAATGYKCASKVKSLRNCVGKLPVDRNKLSRETLEYFQYLEKLKSVEKPAGTQ